MPTKPKTSISKRPTSIGQSRPSRPKVKLWVLWKPPTQLLTFIGIGLMFASVGLLALRYSNAQTPHTQTDSSIIWRDTPDSEVGTSAGTSGADLSLKNWQSMTGLVYGGGNVKVVYDSEKGRAVEFIGAAHKSDNDAYGQNQRAEQIADSVLRKGQTYWIGFDLKVVPGSKVANGRQSVWRLLSQDGDASSSKLWLALNSNQPGLSIETDSSSLRVGDSPENRWTRLTVGVHVADEGSAWYEVWRDGHMAVGRQQVPEGTVSSETAGAMMAAGIYRSMQDWNLSTRMANFEIATEREVVM